jgi:hypothetical protein
VRRRLLLAAGWVLGTVAAGSLAWAGVAVVSDRVTDTPVAVSQQESPPAGPATTESTATSPAPTPPAQPAQQVTALGGTASISCDDGTPALEWATPRPGFEVDVENEAPEPADGEPAGLRVRFRGEEAESRVQATCEAETPVVEVEERN